MIVRRIFGAKILVLAMLANPSLVGQSAAAESARIEMLQRMIRPAAGESRWMEIDWHPNVWEARRKAAEEGKPLFLMAGSGGAPAAGC